MEKGVNKTGIKSDVTEENGQEELFLKYLFLFRRAQSE